MVHQVLRYNSSLGHNLSHYHTLLHKLQNGLDFVEFFTSNQLISIAIITLLVFLLFKANGGSKLISFPGKHQRFRKIVRPKYLLPVRLPVVDSIYTLVKLRKDGLQFLERLSEQYGNLFEFPFGPITLIAISDPVIIQKLLSSTQLAYLNKPKIYNSIFGEVFHNGVLTSENEIWSGQRKLLTRSFTYKSLQNYVVFMNTHAANLTGRLIHECNDNVGIEAQRINQLLTCHAFKIISQIVMGTDSLSPDESNEVADNFNRWKDMVSDRLLNPWKYLWLLPKRRELYHISEYLNNFFVKITQKYKMEYNLTAISLSSQKSTHTGASRDSEDENVGVKPFRCMIEEMLCSGASDQEIYQQLGTILAAGHDTTTVGIKMLMQHLALNPKHQIACREEIDNVLNKKDSQHNICNYTGSIDSLNLTMEDLISLKYLERCILESGRITSVIPFFMRRIDAPLKIDDELEFPAGTNFAVFSWTLHRDPKIYTDPLKFDPDRFLSENVKQRHPYSYTQFSLGPRNCIGSKMAIMETKVIMAYILHHFEIFSDDKLENVKLQFGITVVPERDYKVVLKRREQAMP